MLCVLKHKYMIYTDYTMLTHTATYRAKIIPSVCLVFFFVIKDVSDDDLSARVESIKVYNCASLVYTSGTTGPPKVELQLQSYITNDTINRG